MKPKTKIIIVDDHAIILEGLKSLIELDDSLTVAGEASSSMECLKLLPAILPKLVLLDLKMPGIDGIEATRLIKQRYPNIKVILLTNYDDEEYVIESIKAGADGYVLKDVKKGDLLKIIHTVLKGRAFIDPAVTKKIFYNLKNSSNLVSEHKGRHSLTERELEILSNLAEGKSNKEIAQTIHLSLETVKSHLKNIYQKFNVHNRAQAIKIALQEEIVHFSR